MRLTRTFLLCVVVLLFTSCASNSNVTNSPKTDFISITAIEDVPAFDEFSNLPIDEKHRIKMGIEDIPITASCNTYYNDLIQDFLQDTDEENVFTVPGVTVEQDNLSLVSGKNNKSLYNLILNIKLEMDTVKVYDTYDQLAKDTIAQIVEYLAGDTFYALKVKRCTILIYDLTGNLVRTAERNSSITDESIFREQSETEYAAQSIAYDYAVKNSEFVLEKFGALPDTKELYVEYYVKDSYFGNKEDEINKGIENLENIADSIQDYLLQTNQVDTYVKENSSKILTISFRNGVMEDSYKVFNFKL